MSKQLQGFISKKKGEYFEEYFKNILNQIQMQEDSIIVAYRKHSNEIVKTLANIKRFDLIAKLGYLKGDFDYSITLKGGLTVFVEVKSGKSVLSVDQKKLRDKYYDNNIPYFLFTQNVRKGSNYIKASYSLRDDINTVKKYFRNIQEEK